MTDTRADDEAQIRALVDDQTKAIRAKDIGRRMSKYTPDVLLFDVVNPLRSVGSSAVRKRLSEWFATFQGPIGFELRDLSITAGEDVAFSHSLSQVSATTAGGDKLDMWWRATACYRKLDGQWLVTNEHASVPFDAQSSRASLGLEP
jgi:uncharacterized protein (TIGR02246 family)